MIEAFSKEVTVASGGNIPLENVRIKKGQYEALSGAASIALNHCGVYRVTVNGTATPSEAGTFGVELFKDNIAESNTLTQATAAATSTLLPFSFTTFVQVARSNGACACLSPTVLTVVNTGVATTFNNVNVTLDKVC